VGTFSDMTTLGSVNECQPCTPGKYCGSVALQAPTYDCTAGYYCGLGSSVSTPHDSDPFHVSYVGETCVGVNKTAINDVCPPGHYCPEGSSSPLQCPPGTNSSALVGFDF
jgi:hypothetical protein